MSRVLPEPLQRLIRTLGRLPGVGGRTATRYALQLVRDPSALQELNSALQEVQASVRLCDTCRGLAGADGRCSLCADARRDASRLCVMEGVADMMALEATGLYQGHYFVLHRLLAPLKGIGPQDIGLPALEQRVSDRSIQEVILATPMTTEGETTATYIRKLLAPYPVRVTRLASGVPVGGAIEFLDQVTLSHAIEGRKDFGHPE